MSGPKNICFIPAKGGSTRLKEKNILPLKGKPLLYYPLRNAQESGLFDRADIILSTESPKIRKVAEKWGAKVPYLRDEALAKDPYGVVHVALNFFDLFPLYREYDNLCIVFPTTPLAIAEDVVKGYEILEKGNFCVVMSVTETEHSPLRAVLVEGGVVRPLHPEFIEKQSTELPKTYRINGAVVWIKVKEFLEKKTYFIQPWGAYIMPAHRSVDIDQREDYLYAKYLMEQQTQTDGNAG